mmetsp:Transcript_7242/g.10776  ORF Transcript_7242/g.10776 Transcript_7242/m.10776 type:complete len:199 (+) Transcript_7242:127-723(+)
MYIKSFHIYTPYHTLTQLKYITTNTFQYTIRQATLQDIIHIQHCNQRNLPENYKVDFYYHQIHIWPTLSLVAENSDKKIIAYAFGRIINWDINTTNGLLWATSYGSTAIAHVSSIATDASYRRAGIAKSLMNCLHAKFRQYPQIDCVNLYCRVSNVAAISHYIKVHGYVCHERLFGYYLDGEDAWVMLLRNLKKHDSE